MFYQKINQLVKENSCQDADNLLPNLNLEDPKVIFYIISAPGPGTYRLPSDFGQYDELIHSPAVSKGGDFGKTGRTTSTSHHKRD